VIQSFAIWSWFNYLAFHTTFDIYVLITITGSLPLLMDYLSPRVSSAQ